jgi:hypothetical protein
LSGIQGVKGGGDHAFGKTGVISGTISSISGIINELPRAIIGAVFSLFLQLKNVYFRSLITIKETRHCIKYHCFSDSFL